MADTGNRFEGSASGPVVQADTINSLTLGGAGTVSVRDAIRDHSALLATVLRDGFTGRAWVLEQIDAFLRTRPCGYLWVEGEAGVGKTALAAYLVRERGWIGHFAAVPRGASVLVGLRNLAGRIAERYDLAEAGTLPAPTFTPDGFDTLLARAAERAAGPLVLVVDGADEADPSPGTQPWGLPNVLPDGVYVVGTYRTGGPPPRCVSPSAVVRIAADDPRNRADLVTHLRAALPDARADALAGGCGGVWIYLRYVLDEIRQGVRHDLDSLPDGLPAFYVASLDRWCADRRWDDGLLPVLATLAVAGEPLPTTTLATLAGVDEPLVRRLCHTTLRPFLGVTGSGPRTFGIYHASLCEFLTGATPGPDAPDQEWLWAETLGSAAIAAHGRIADHYLGALQPVPGYSRRHLVRHLVGARRFADLHRLLGAAHRSGHDRVVNTWFAAHDDAGTLDDYLADLATAMRDARRRTDRALATHQPAAALADELRYHLVAASITSRTANVPVDLLTALLRDGVWTSARAVAHAGRLPGPANRALALTALVPHLPAGQRDDALARALAAAFAVSAGYVQADLLIRVAALLPADLCPPVVAKAVDATLALAGEHQRAERLRALAPHLSGEQLDVVLANADAVVSPTARAAALTALAPHLPAESRPAVLARALTAASMISGERQRAAALAALARYVPGQALAVAGKITNDEHRAEALCAIAPHLPVPRRREIVGDVAAAPVEALTRLAADLDPDARAAVLCRATAVADAISSDLDRAEALTALAPLVPESDVDSVSCRALAAARAIPSGSARAAALAGLARQLPAVREEALAAALTVHSEQSRGALLTGLAPCLPPRQRRLALTEALAAALTISSSYTHIATLVNAPDPPPEPGPDATTARHDRGRPEVAPADRLTAALAVATVTIVSGPAPTVVRPAGTLADAVAVADPHVRIRRLARLAPFLAPHERAAAMARQLADLAGAPDDDARARSLATVVPHLPADRVEDVDRALALVAGSTADVSAALGGLVPNLTTAAQLAAALALISRRDRILLCALLTRAGEILEPGPDQVELLRRALRSVDRDTCLALLRIAVPRLREIAGPDFDAETWAALRDVHRWWP